MRIKLEGTEERMGAASSVENGGNALEVATQEVQKPLDGSDVDTPRGVSAKQEVRRLRKLIADFLEQDKEKTKALLGGAPSIKTYLERVFAKWDKDKNGVLNKEEFWTMMDSLNLGLTGKEIAKLQKLTDKNEDDSVSLAEFVEAAPEYFRKAADESATEIVWMQLEDPSGHPYYYNKKTLQSTWHCPEEFLNQLGEIAKREEDNLLPEVKDFIRKAFQKADKDQSGTLSYDEFFDLLATQINLGLSEERFLLLMERFDVNKDDQIKWEEYIAVIPTLLKQINQDEDEMSCWQKQRTRKRTFFLNTKTGATAWEMPALPEDL